MRPKKIFAHPDDPQRAHVGWRTKVISRLVTSKRGPKHRKVIMGLESDGCFTIYITASDGEIITSITIENEPMMRGFIEHIEAAIAHRKLTYE